MKYIRITAYLGLGLLIALDIQNRTMEYDRVVEEVPPALFIDFKKGTVTAQGLTLSGLRIKGAKYQVITECLFFQHSVRLTSGGLIDHCYFKGSDEVHTPSPVPSSNYAQSKWEKKKGP